MNFNNHILGWICMLLCVIGIFTGVKKQEFKYLLLATICLGAAWINLSM